MEKNRNNSQWHSLLKRVAVIISMLIILAGGGTYVLYLMPLGNCYDGLNCCVYGDSITEIGSTWIGIIEDRLGFDDIYNRGIGSTGYTDTGIIAYVNDVGECLGRSNIDNEQPAGTIAIDGKLSSQERISTIPLDSDIVLVMAGTNDWGSCVPLSTFKDAIVQTITEIRNHFNQDVEVVLLSPLSGRESGTKEEAINSLGLKTSDYASAVEEAASQCSVPYIDIFGDTIIEQWNRDLFISDNVHPNKLGQLEISRVISWSLYMMGDKLYE